MSTIARNTKKAAEVFENATRCVYYGAYNGFSGDDCDPNLAREAFNNDMRSRLYQNERGYTVHVHANLWYELTA